MKRKIFIILIFFLSTQIININIRAQQIDNNKEAHRPQIHFSPKAHWMNDPNGMVYNNGTYHLFFQYYPDRTVWGPLHWGRGTCKGLLHWNPPPIALDP